MITNIWEFLKFTYHMLRPRAVKWWWRMGSFDCACWSYDWCMLKSAAFNESRKRS